METSVHCPPAIDFKAFVRLPPLHPVLDLPSPHLPTCSPQCESICFCGHFHLMASMRGLGGGMLNVCTGFGGRPRAAPISSLTQAGGHAPNWGKPRGALKREQELCAIFLATRAGFCSTVSQHFCFLIRSLADSWLYGSLAATQATWKLLLLHLHAPSFPYTSFSDLHKIKENHPPRPKIFPCWEMYYFLPFKRLFSNASQENF